MQPWPRATFLIILGPAEQDLPHPFPVIMDPAELSQLDQGAERQLAEVVAVRLNEGQDLLGADRRDAFTLKQLASRGNVVDPEADRLQIVEPEVEVQGARHERLEVSYILVAAVIHVLLEIQVADKNNRALKLVGVRDLAALVVLERQRFLHPIHPPSRRRVTQGLQDVERILIREDRISVVQHDNVARLAIVVAKLVKIDRAEGALHDLVGGVLIILRLLEHVRNREGLAHARRPSDHERPDVGVNSSRGELAEHPEALHEIAEHLSIRTPDLNLVSNGSTLQEICLRRTTALSRHSERHICYSHPIMWATAP